jgi:hypothetical protein
MTTTQSAKQFNSIYVMSNLSDQQTPFPRFNTPLAKAPSLPTGRIL